MSESRLGWPWPRWPLEHAANGVDDGGHDDGRMMMVVVAILSLGGLALFIFYDGYEGSYDLL